MQLKEKKDLTVLDNNAIKQESKGSSAENLPLDVMNITCSYLSMHNLAMIMRASKRWHIAGLTQWRFLLANDFDVDPVVVKPLKYPNRIYFELVKTLTRPNENWDESWSLMTSGYLNWPLHYLEFIQLYGINNFCVCLGIEDSNEFDKFFKSNTQPTLNDVVILGNLAVVKYYIKKLGRVPNQETLKHAIWSGSVSLINFLIDECGLDSSKEKPYNWRYPPKEAEVLEQWQELAPDLDYVRLMLIGSVDLAKKLMIFNSGNIASVSSNDKLPILHNTLRSYSLPLIKWFFESLCNTPPDQPFYDLKKTLDRSAHIGALSIVKYFIEAKQIIPNLETLNNAARSGSLPLLRYLIQKLAQSFNVIKPDYETLRQAVLSGSLLVTKYLIEECKIIPKDSLLADAAELGLLPNLRYLINSRQLLPNKKILDAAARSNFVSALRYLIREKNIRPDQATLKETKNVIVMRYLVEEEYLIPTQETASGTTRAYDMQQYLKLSIKYPNKTPSFWNNMLSLNCTSALRSLGRAIIFNSKQLQQWPIKCTFRNGVYFANLERYADLPRIRLGERDVMTGPHYYLVVSDCVSNSAHKSIALPRTMYEIIVIIQKAIEDAMLVSNLFAEDKLYPNALKEVHAMLGQALEDGYDDQKVLDFYKQWHGILSNVIIGMKESQRPEISVPSLKSA